MSEENKVQELLQAAIAAAREGDKSRARMLLDEVVELDAQNEKAWYWLASVVDTDEERIAYLKNVLLINPNNERAQMVLQKIEARKADDALRQSVVEVAPGIDRRVILYGGGGLAVMLVLILLVAVIIISGNNRRARNEQATADAIAAIAQATRDAAATAELVASETAAAVALIASPTPLAPTLPPTWTPVPSPTSAMQVTATPLATAVGSGQFTGRLLAASGQDTLGEGFVPLVEIPLDGSPPRQFFDDRANAPSISPQGDMMIYTRYSPATREQGLELMYRNSSEPPRLMSTLLGGRILQMQDDGNFSPDGSRIAFSAREPGSRNRDIYVVSLQALQETAGEGQSGGETAAARALVRLTDGSVDSTAPSWGDSSRMVFVEDSTNNGGGVDLKMIDLNGTITNLTTDGNALMEDNPEISPDGQRVAFEGHSLSNPEDVDIYIMAMSGGMPLLVVDSPAMDVRPRWSPDGRYLAFSSNRSGGGFEIYIVEVDTYAVYQVTVNDVFDMVNDWIP